MADPLPRITADDDTIRAALEDAHIPSLMVALVHLTGDAEILRGDIKPEISFLGDPQGGITEEQQAQIRERALDALRRYRDSDGQLPRNSSRIRSPMFAARRSLVPCSPLSSFSFSCGMCGRRSSSRVRSPCP